MSIQVSDTEIRAEIRSLLIQNRFDIQRVKVRITSGTVRISGDLVYVGAMHMGNVSGAVMHVFERDVAQTRGVKHTYFDLRNWQRLSTGEWQPVVPKKAPTSGHRPFGVHTSRETRARPTHRPRFGTR